MPDLAPALAAHAGEARRVSCPNCRADEPELLLRHERWGTQTPTVVCRRCALVYLLERWPEEAYDRFYDSDEYRSLAGKPDPADLHARQLIRGGSIAAFCSPLLPTAPRVLDVGCSTGGIMQAFAWATGAHVVGIEPSSEEAAYPIARGLTVHVAPLAQVDLPEASFDLAVLAGVLDHLVEPFDDLRRVRRLLRPGGLLYVSVSDFVELAKHRPDPAALDHLTYYTSATLRHLVQGIGFQPIRWTADAHAESRTRHPDLLESHIGPWLTVQGLFRSSEETVPFQTMPDWRRLATDLDAALARHHRPLTKRIARRVRRTISTSFAS